MERHIFVPKEHNYEFQSNCGISLLVNEKYFNPPSEMGEQAKQRRCIEY